MTDEKDEHGELLSDEKRLTKFGKFLRSTSIDELPELLNILKGDMSIVGPRPQLIKDLVFMNENIRKRHDVLPGLTGLAQINGRNDITWEDKFKEDNSYVHDLTFFKDIKIITLTFLKVLKRDSINTTGMATAEDYGDYLLSQGKITKAYYNSKLKEVAKLQEKGSIK